MIQGIKLVNFRNFKERSFEFGKNITLITGKNGTGKTNLLEAVASIIYNGKAFHSDNKFLIKNGENFLFSELIVKDKSGIISKFGLSIDEKGKKYFKDSKRKYKLPSIYKDYPLLIILPEHREIFRGERALRRNFFDGMISRLEPDYSKKLSTYNKILRSRRFLLYEGKTNHYYDSEWKKYASLIINKRIEYISKVNELFKNIIKVDIVLGYATTLGKIISNDIDYLNDKIEYRLKKSSLEEIKKKKILFGPHLDDFKIIYNSLNTKNFSSSGEIKFVLMWIKFAEVMMIKEKYKVNPIILIDEFSDSLDMERTMELIERFPENQILLTTCHSDIASSLKNTKRIEL